MILKILSLKYMYFKITFLYFILTFFTACTQPSADTYRFMYYNVENLFDTVDDLQKNDNEFLPTGAKKWNYYRYNQKLLNIAKVIIALGEENLPVVVGLGEIENKKVLTDLIENTPLIRTDYDFIHYESPNERGIDVALLYRKDIFKILSHKNYPIYFDQNPNIKTRDILYVRGEIDEDTVSIFVNHWPSRRGGVVASESKRLTAANKLKLLIDDYHQRYPNDLQIVMGDFNDDPINRSVSMLSQQNKKVAVLNPFQDIYKSGKGTLKYKGRWNLFDQIIITGNTTYLSYKYADIFDPDWLYKHKNNSLSGMPYRTYQGPIYIGGFSDHFPVFVELAR